MRQGLSSRYNSPVLLKFWVLLLLLMLLIKILLPLLKIYRGELLFKPVFHDIRRCVEFSWTTVKGVLLSAVTVDTTLTLIKFLRNAFPFML